LPEIHGALLRRSNDGDVMNALHLKLLHRALLTSTKPVVVGQVCELRATVARPAFRLRADSSLGFYRSELIDDLAVRVEKRKTGRSVG
jgi:hypothetical protein